jgi:hypothetical protein
MGFLFNLKRLLSIAVKVVAFVIEVVALCREAKAAYDAFRGARTAAA